MRFWQAIIGKIMTTLHLIETRMKRALIIEIIANENMNQISLKHFETI